MKKILLLLMSMLILNILTFSQNESFQQVSTTINSVELEEVKIYPNPTLNTITIESNSIIIDIVIFNINGQVVSTMLDINSINKNIDLSNFDKGIYFIKVDNKITKVMKQ